MRLPERHPRPSRRVAVLSLCLGVAAARLPAQRPRLVVPVGHTRDLQSVAFSVDGARLLSADNNARVWDAETGRELLLISNRAVPFASAFFVRGDSAVATVDVSGGWIRVWNAVSGAAIDSLRDSTLLAGAVARDGRLALATRSGIALYDSRDLRRGPIGAVRAPAMQKLHWAPRGDVVVGIRENGVVAVVHVDEPKVDTFRVKAFATAAAISPDGRLLAVASTAQLFELWSLTTGKQLFADSIPGGHTAALADIVFLNDSTVTTVARDGSARLWRITAAGVRAGVAVHAPGRQALAVAATPAGDMLAVGYNRGDLRLWNARTGTPRRQLSGRVAGLVAVAWSRDSAFLATAATDTLIRIWDNKTGRLIHTLRGHTADIRGLAFAPDDSTIASAGNDGVVRLWNARTGQPVRTVAAIGRPIQGLAFSPSGRQLATVSLDSVVRVWSVTGEPRIALRSREPATSIVFLDESRFVTASLSSDTVRTFRIVDSTATPIWTQAAAGRGGIRALARSEDGQYLAAATIAGNARLLHIVPRAPPLEDSVELIAHRSLPAGLVGRIAIVGSPAHPRVAVTMDADLLIWDPASSGSVERLRNHTGGVRDVAASADGRLLATAGDDGTVRLWRVGDGGADSTRLLLTRATMDSADWAAVSPDGRFEGSQRGISRLHYVYQGHAIGLEAFLQRYYDPGLSVRALTDPASGSTAFRSFGLPPTTSVEVHPNTTATSARVVFKGVDAGGGVQALRLYQNGTLVAGVSEDGLLLPEHADSSMTYVRGHGAPTPASCATECAVNVRLVPGLNLFEAAASATDGTSSERRGRFAIGKGAASPSRLFVLAVAIDRYHANGMKNNSLTYPVADAKSIADALTKGSLSIFSEVHLDTLYDDAASRTGVLGALTRIKREIKPGDVFVFFYAGHGTVTSTGQFHLALAGVESLTDDASLTREGLSEASLRAAFDVLPALKKVLIMDACRSGTALAAGMATRPLQADATRPVQQATRATAGVATDGAARGVTPLTQQTTGPQVDAMSPVEQAAQRAAAQLARSRGIFVLAAASPDQSALEHPALGHGALTYALLQAMAPDDDNVPRARTVRGISAYVEREVPELALRLGHALQYPMAWSYGQDFPLVVP